MFGHQDEPTQQTNNDNDQIVTGGQDNGPTTDGQNPALPPADVNFAPTGSVATVVSPMSDQVEPQPTGDDLPSASTLPDDVPADDVTADSPATDQPAQDQPATVGTPTPLNDLKQQALQQLSPLVGQLEQTPEEKFRTTMMMIQASDNQDLLQTAYEAANQITDEKAKAQALLDVINEINYFSQK